MSITSLIEKETLKAGLNFEDWLERRCVDELRQMQFTTDVKNRVQALIQEFDSRPPNQARQRRMTL